MVYYLPVPETLHIPHEDGWRQTHLGRLLGRDPLDHAIGLIPASVRSSHEAMTSTENGYLRWYAASLALGAVVVLGIVVLA